MIHIVVGRAAANVFVCSHTCKHNERWFPFMCVCFARCTIAMDIFESFVSAAVLNISSSCDPEWKLYDYPASHTHMRSVECIVQRIVGCLLWFRCICSTQTNWNMLVNLFVLLRLHWVARAIFCKYVCTNRCVCECVQHGLFARAKCSTYVDVRAIFRLAYTVPYIHKRKISGLSLQMSQTNLCIWHTRNWTKPA